MHENKPPGSAPTFDLTGKRVWVAGHTGMVGGALMRRLEAENCDIITATRGEVDLTRQAETEAFVAAHRPQAVFLAAAKVGGILANNELRGDFIYQNTMIAANVIHAAHISGVRKLLFLGSTCIYPRMAEQPMREEALLSGPLEPTNEPYAVAKIAGVKMCQAYRAQYGCDFISAMPTNAYGPGDNYDPGHSHVVAALIRRFHEARVAGADTVSVWGSGTPRREFIHVDDIADACVHLMKVYSHPDIVNIGVGEDMTIADFAQLVARIVGYRGTITYDTNRPDGAPRKLVDTKRLSALGWRAPTRLETGLASAYEDFLSRRSGLA